MKSCPWYSRRQRSNSAGANTITDGPAVAARAGFSIVVDGFTARAQNPAVPTKPGTLFATVTDAVASSFVVGGTEADATGAGAPAAYVSGEKVTPHVFSEGQGISVTVTGNGEAQGVGYTIDYHYEPMFSGFTSTQP